MDRKINMQKRISRLKWLQTYAGFQRRGKTREEIVREKGWYVPSIHRRDV